MLRTLLVVGTLALSLIGVTGCSYDGHHRHHNSRYDSGYYGGRYDYGRYDRGYDSCPPPGHRGRY